MNNNVKPLFTTGEFAKLCNVRKDTLFYYDEIGLLKPEIIQDNGYRYYSANQLYLFDVISMLKECGTPLKEIREYITESNISATVVRLLNYFHENMAREEFPLGTIILKDNLCKVDAFTARSPGVICEIVTISVNVCSVSQPYFLTSCS